MLAPFVYYVTMEKKNAFILCSTVFYVLSQITLFLHQCLFSFRCIWDVSATIVQNDGLNIANRGLGY